MSFWFLAWSPARTPVRSKNWQLQPKRQQKWHVYPFIPPQFLCLISADTPYAKLDQPQSDRREQIRQGENARLRGDRCCRGRQGSTKLVCVRPAKTKRPIGRDARRRSAC